MEKTETDDKRAELIRRLNACADDPMWADHAEVSKGTLRRAAIMLEADGEDAKSLTDYKALYHELLFAVGNKYPDETRHQTAMRYIRQAEELITQTAQQTSGIAKDKS